MIHSGDVKEALPHASVGKLKANHAGRSLLAAVPWKDGVRGGDLDLAILHVIVVVLHRVDEALRSVFVVLQDGTLVPGLVDGRGVVVAEFPIRVHLNLPENELPAGQATHGGHKTQISTEPLYQLALLVALKSPNAVTGVRDLGIEDKQVNQLLVAIVGIITQGFAATVYW